MVTIGQTDLSPQILVPKTFPVPAGPKNQNWPKKKIPPGENPKDSRNTRVQLRKCHKTRYAAPKFGPKMVSSTKKVLCHAQNPNFQLSLGFYLDTDQILKVWSPLDKRISLLKFWSQKGFQGFQGPKIKIGQKKKKIPPGDNPKDSRNTRVQLRKCHKTRYAAPKFVTDRQTDRQTDKQTFSDPRKLRILKQSFKSFIETI